MNRLDGFTLIELMIVVALVGIIMSFAVLGFDILQRQSLASATTGFLADLQTVRMNALTKSSAPDSRGFGLRFLTNDSYRIFEFVDNGANNFIYETDDTEKVDYEKTLSSGITVTLQAAGTPVGLDNALLYDKRGMVRSNTWSSVTNRTYVLRHPKVAGAKCVTVSMVRIRGGNWNGTDCDLQ